jgi:anti-sigma B factor antagonist
VTVDVDSQGRTARLCLSGRLVLESSTVVKSEIQRCLAQGRTDVILNMAGVEFINSSGIGVLVSALKEVRLAQGHLVLCNLAQYVQEIFEVTQLSNIFELHASEDEARDALEAVHAQA